MWHGFSCNPLSKLVYHNSKCPTTQLVWCGCTCTTARCSLLTVSRGSHSMPWLVAPMKHCMCKCGHAVLLVKRSEVQPATARDNVLSVSRHTCIRNILDHPPTHPNPLQQPLGHYGMHVWNTDWTDCPITCSVGPLISRSDHYTNRYYTKPTHHQGLPVAVPKLLVLRSTTAYAQFCLDLVTMHS